MAGQYPNPLWQTDPPCADNRPCECGLCTCQKCRKELAYDEYTDSMWCTDCDEHPAINRRSLQSKIDRLLLDVENHQRVRENHAQANLEAQDECREMRAVMDRYRSALERIAGSHRDRTGTDQIIAEEALR